VAVLYRWVCPECRAANTLHGVPPHGALFCPGCHARFEAGPVSHRLGEEVLSGVDLARLVGPDDEARGPNGRPRGQPGLFDV
jgi:hypothetical protein